MDVLINIGFAWIAMILGALLAVIYILRIVNKAIYNNKNKFLTNLNRALRKSHKIFGILIVITGLIHGLYSSFDVVSLNLGTLTWIITILLGLNWMFRKKFKYLGKSWIIYHRGLTSVFIIALVVHIVTVGGFVGVEYVAQNVLGDFKGQHVSARENKESIVDMEDVEVNNNRGKEYIDGVYHGEADGYRPGLQVAVTIENGLIANVEVVNHNEHKERFYGPPIEQIPEAIVEAQSIDVDSVSGSTYTSQGIKNAVDKALKDALID